jgi:predicted ATP-binding protein involved in virulence
MLRFNRGQGIFKVSQLSDGIKNMLGMVADIAYRCVLLNSHLGASAAEKTEGVVMIDEIEMHLHPHFGQARNHATHILRIARSIAPHNSTTGWDRIQLCYSASEV